MTPAAVDPSINHATADGWSVRLQRARRRLPWVIFSGLAIWLFSIGFSVAVVDSPSVQATVVLVTKGVPARRGDLVQYDYPGVPVWVYYGPAYQMVHQVVGLPGDRIEARTTLTPSPYCTPRAGDPAWLAPQCVELTVAGRSIGTALPGGRNISRLNPLIPPGGAAVIPSGFVFVASVSSFEFGFDSRYAEHSLVPITSLHGRVHKLF